MKWRLEGCGGLYVARRYSSGVSRRTVQWPRLRVVAPGGGRKAGAADGAME